MYEQNKPKMVLIFMDNLGCGEPVYVEVVS